MSASCIRTAILADDSVAVFNESIQRMISLNRTAAYLWFRHAEVDHGVLAEDLAARTGMLLADAKRTVDEHIATWKAAGFIASDDPSHLAAVADLAARPSYVQDALEQTYSVDETNPALRIDAGACLFGRLTGLNFCIHYEPELRPLLEPALQHLLGPTSSPDLTIEIRRNKDGWTVLNSLRVASGALKTNEVVPVVIYALLDGLLRRSGNSIAFHASAVRRNGRCVLLAAPAGSGKSTLSAALVCRGYEFIADDVVFFDGVTLGLRGVPLPLSLKEGSWSPLINAYPELEAAAVHLRPDRRPVKFLIPRRIAPASESHAVTAVVFPRFVSGTDVELRSIDQSLALNRLVSEASTPSLCLSGDRFADLASLVRPTSCWELRFSDLAAAANAIDQICQEQGPTPVAGRSGS